VIRSWGAHVGEYHAGAAKDIVFQLNALIDRNVVLDFDIIADPHIRTYEDILTDRAITPNVGVSHNMSEMPNLCTRPNLTWFVDTRGMVDEVRECGRRGHIAASA
jgi:hypothetical protein